MSRSASLEITHPHPHRHFDPHPPSQAGSLAVKRCMRPVLRARRLSASPDCATAGQAGLMPKRLPQQWQLLHPVVSECTCCPAPRGLMPLGISLEWRLLSGEQQLVKSRNRQKRQLPIWVSHQRRLLFTQLRLMLCAKQADDSLSQRLRLAQLTHEVLLHLASRLVIHQVVG